MPEKDDDDLDEIMGEMDQKSTSEIMGKSDDTSEKGIDGRDYMDEERNRIGAPLAWGDPSSASRAQCVRPRVRRTLSIATMLSPVTTSGG